ncbi:type II toxin-antitoxin system VapC family toxin [soil metagenome]
MIVLDTHAWIWLTSDPARLSATARAAVDDAESIGVCTISCWEVGMLVVAGRIRIDRDPRRWIRLALAVQGTTTLPPSAEIAVSAALLPATFPGDPADRLIYATAVAHGVRLITRDERISAFDPQRTIW